MMRLFGVLLGVVLSVGILSGVVWYNRYSPAAVKAAIDAKKQAERAKRARMLAEDIEAGTPLPPEGDEGAHAAEPPPLITPEGPYPKAVAAERTFDFGSMAKDEERKHTFTIKNEGTIPLKLSKGATTCKCTISNLPTRELPPGQTVEIEVSWTPRDLDNNFLKEARIQTNDPDNAEIRLQVKGKVVQEFIVSPSHEWNFGNVAENSPAEVVTTISSALVDKFQIKNVESSHPSLTSVATPLPEDKLKLFGAKSGYEFKTTLAPGIPVGPFDQNIKLHTDLPGDKTISISVKAFRAGPLRFLPARGGAWTSERMMLNLGRFTASEGKMATLPVFVQGLKEDFKITELTADPKFIEVTLTGDAAEELSRRAYQLKFHVPPNQPIMSKTAGAPARVVLKTNHPDAAEIVIELLYVSY